MKKESECCRILRRDYRNDPLILNSAGKHVDARHSGNYRPFPIIIRLDYLTLCLRCLEEKGGKEMDMVYMKDCLNCCMESLIKGRRKFRNNIGV